jgi:hypothetical protein
MIFKEEEEEQYVFQMILLVVKLKIIYFKIITFNLMEQQYIYLLYLKIVK